VTLRIWPTLPKNHGHDMSHLNFLSFTIQFGKKSISLPTPTYEMVYITPWTF
jgi:hypothetical protein